MARTAQGDCAQRDACRRSSGIPPSLQGSASSLLSSPLRRLGVEVIPVKVGNAGEIERAVTNSHAHPMAA